MTQNAVLLPLKSHTIFRIECKIFVLCANVLFIKCEFGKLESINVYQRILLTVIWKERLPQAFRLQLASTYAAESLHRKSLEIAANHTISFYYSIDHQDVCVLLISEATGQRKQDTKGNILGEINVSEFKLPAHE